MIGFGQLDQQVVDFILRQMMVAGRLADEYPGCTGTDQVENFRRYQAVVDDHISLAQSLDRLQCQQIRIPRTSPHEMYRCVVQHLAAPFVDASCGPILRIALSRSMIDIICGTGRT